MNLLASGLVSALMGLVMLGVLYRTPRGALRKAACRAGGLEGMTTTSFYMRNCWNWQTGSVEVAVFIRACGFKSHVPHQIPFTLSVEAMSFTFIPRFNYPELSNNSLRLCRICRCGGMVDTNALGAFATWRAGSSPVIGTTSDIINKDKKQNISKVL